MFRANLLCVVVKIQKSRDLFLCTGFSKEKLLSYPVLVDIYKNSNKRHLRSSVLASFAKIGNDKSISHIKDALNDRDSMVRKSALRNLGRLGERGNHKAIAVLKEALENRDKDVKARARKILDKIEKK